MQKHFDKTKDIIGHTFTKLKLQKIDDVNYDNRFDETRDRNLCFYSKSMICFPLIVKKGNALVFFNL